MINTSEYVELKLGTVFSEMESKTGLSIGEIQQRDRLDALKAEALMVELGIDYPEPTSKSIQCFDSGVSSRGYKGKRFIPGRAIAEKGFVKLAVFTSVAIESDGKLWFHASVTRDDGHMPSYADLCWLRDEFFGDRWAMQYFPPKEQHVSHHDKCLHLWTCLQSFEIPDFRKFGTI